MDAQGLALVEGLFAARTLAAALAGAGDFSRLARIAAQTDAKAAAQDAAEVAVRVERGFAGNVRRVREGASPVEVARAYVLRDRGGRRVVAGILAAGAVAGEGGGVLDAILPRAAASFPAPGDRRKAIRQDRLAQLAGGAAALALRGSGQCVGCGRERSQHSGSATYCHRCNAGTPDEERRRTAKAITAVLAAAGPLSARA